MWGDLQQHWECWGVVKGQSWECWRDLPGHYEGSISLLEENWRVVQEQSGEYWVDLQGHVKIFLHLCGYKIKEIILYAYIYFYSHFC